MEQAERINAAIALMGKHSLRSEAVRTMMQRYGISRRQAYRYLCIAERTEKPMAVPEEKVVFTVKLPKGLAVRVRKFSRRWGTTLSAVVTEALEKFLRSGRRHG